MLRGKGALEPDLLSLDPACLLTYLVQGRIVDIRKNESESVCGIWSAVLILKDLLRTFYQYENMV